LPIVEKSLKLRQLAVRASRLSSTVVLVFPRICSPVLVIQSLFGIHVDCYVAVTGLPTPQPNHAIIMTHFARDCRNKMQEVIQELESELGSDTRLLALRIGLHSGPTTAGVLRGAKSRFQLFGDTVNTSARMESNGEKNRIHVSAATADLLVAAGKGLWVKKRTDLVEAKGKGKMQTYWVEPASAASQHSSSHMSSDVDEDENDEAVANLLKSVEVMINQPDMRNDTSANSPAERYKAVSNPPDIFDEEEFEC